MASLTIRIFFLRREVKILAKPSLKLQALKTVLASHGLISLIIGAILLTRASSFAKTAGWERFFDPVMTHVVGAALITFGIGSLIAYLNPSENAVVIRLEIIFAFLACVTVLFSLLFRAELTPSAAWVLAGFNGAFAVLFLILYPTE